MTMALVYSDEKAELIRAVLPEWVPVYKEAVPGKNIFAHVGCTNMSVDHWYSGWMNVGPGGYYRYSSGLQVAGMPTLTNSGKSEYLMGYHFHTCPTPHRLHYMRTIKCYVHKSWITNMGRSHKDRLVLVSPFAVFPKYPKTDVKLSDIMAELERQKATDGWNNLPKVPSFEHFTRNCRHKGDDNK